MNTFSRKIKRLLREIFLLPVKLYQLSISPMLPQSCRFVPTCSQYALDAVREHGIFKGFLMTLHRLWRCRPGGDSGYDPVPPKRAVFNAHTHDRSAPHALINLHENDAVPSEGTFSAGIHPWDAADVTPERMEAFMDKSMLPYVVAIGECGLDLIKGPALDTQIEVFEAQARRALELGKPLIIHCVRAYDTLLRLNKQLRPSHELRRRSPWMIHGFRGKEALGKQLLDNDLYLSLNPHISPATAQALDKYAPGRVFLETDDAAMTIEEASKLTGLRRRHLPFLSPRSSY